jgi:hypothetical protein
MMGRAVVSPAAWSAAADSAASVRGRAPEVPYEAAAWPSAHQAASTRAR